MERVDQGVEGAQPQSLPLASTSVLGKLLGFASIQSLDFSQ